MDGWFWTLIRRFRVVMYFVIWGPLIGALLFSTLGSITFGLELFLYVMTFGLPFAYGLGAGPAVLTGICFVMLSPYARRPFVIMACALVGGLAAYYFVRTTPYEPSAKGLVVTIATISGAVIAGLRFRRDSRRPIKPPRKTAEQLLAEHQQSSVAADASS